MNHSQHMLSTNRMLILFLVVVNTIIIKTAFTEDHSWYRALFVTIPLLLVFIIQSFQKETS